jgi:hypothetical protein
MKCAAIPVLLLAILLAASNSVCAMSCSAMPCENTSPLPPCHQHQGAKLCQGALPVADVATPEFAIASVGHELPITLEFDAWTFEWPPVSAPLPYLSSFRILRI